MGDHHEELFDDLPPCLVLLDSIAEQFFPFFVITGFSYNMSLLLKEVDYEFICFMGMAVKAFLTGDYNRCRQHEEQQPKLSPRRPASLTYSGTPVLKGLKDIVETLPSGLDSSAANSIMPMNKPEQKKTLLLSGALLSRRVVEV
ncbi:bZIP transcription factor [Trifolium medium]|uniref:BZIP transcription factor n=1 Tax=Trifolium medium TaxID=97028 RepID=A0A392M073_9FABA|nr:bZIP transcription factor [Trifolium medium]